MSTGENRGIEKRLEGLSTKIDLMEQTLNELTDLMKTSSEESKERDEKLFKFLFSRRDAVGIFTRIPSA